MHEMSLALNIVDLVATKAAAEGARTINQVEVEVGSLAGVMAEALAFCFEAASRDTLLAGCDLQIRHVQAEGKCTPCQEIFAIDSFFNPCPKCGSYEVEIIQGRDLKVLSIVVDE